MNTTSVMCTHPPKPITIFPDHVEALLSHGVDPNFSSSKSDRPVLLAAHHARPGVLDVLKRFSGPGKTGSRPVCFNVWSESESDTVLHHVLKKSSVRSRIGGIGTEKDLKEIDSR